MQCGQGPRTYTLAECATSIKVQIVNLSERPLVPVQYKQLVNSGPPGGVISPPLGRCSAGRDFRNNIKYGEDIRLFV